MKWKVQFYFNYLEDWNLRIRDYYIFPSFYFGSYNLQLVIWWYFMISCKFQPLMVSDYISAIMTWKRTWVEYSGICHDRFYHQGVFSSDLRFNDIFEGGFPVKSKCFQFPEANHQLSYGWMASLVLTVNWTINALLWENAARFYIRTSG